MQDVKILVVDDDALYRETLVCYGRKLGCDLFDAPSGNEAYKILQSLPIDGIITDLRMPDGTGIELMKKVRNWGKDLPRIPKIVVNTGLLEGGEKYLLALGASRVFLKPIDIKTLLTCLIDLIQKSRPAS